MKIQGLVTSVWHNIVKNRGVAPEIRQPVMEELAPANVKAGHEVDRDQEMLDRALARKAHLARMNKAPKRAKRKLQKLARRNNR